VAAVAWCQPLAQRNGGRHGCGSRHHPCAVTAHCRGGNKDTGGNSDGGGTHNNQQLTKRSGSNGDRNGDDDSDNNDNGNKGDGGGGSLARARHWRWQQHGGGFRQRQRSGGSTAAAAAAAGQRSKDALGDMLEGQVGGGGVAVLVELRRGVPHQVL
jgi:hypothetical protein